jgi:hypothetical protein
VLEDGDDLSIFKPPETDMVVIRHGSDEGASGMNGNDVIAS